MEARQRCALSIRSSGRFQGRQVEHHRNHPNEILHPRSRHADHRFATRNPRCTTPGGDESGEVDGRFHFHPPTMADFATTWPESGPLNTFVLLIFSDSVGVPQRHRRPEHQLTRARPSTASNRIPGGNHSSEAKPVKLEKSARREFRGEIRCALFICGGGIRGAAIHHDYQIDPVGC